MEDRQLTEHFTLYQLTRTDRSEFQERNRDVTEDQIAKLTALAKLLEHVQFILEVPITINSAYRCKDLNDAIHSTDKSQHLLCEAADFVPTGQDIGSSFRTLWKDVKVNGANVGQLIHETAARSYGVTSWIHISLGTPYRDAAKCKQVLRMQDGKYETLA